MDQRKLEHIALESAILVVLTSIGFTCVVMVWHGFEQGKQESAAFVGIALMSWLFYVTAQILYKKYRPRLKKINLSNK